AAWAPRAPATTTSTCAGCADRKDRTDPTDLATVLERTIVRNYSRVVPSGLDLRGPKVSHPLRIFCSARSAPTAERTAPVDRQKNLEMALSQIEKQFGKGSVMKMGEKGTMAIEAVSTGALSLDLALGIGGLPRGRVTEIYGPE